MRPFIQVSDLKQLFSERKIKNVFHANAIETSISFFSIDSLISRDAVEQKSLPQTEQYSDEADKKYGIFGDIWLNFSDFHKNFKRPNEYGPVTFRFPLFQILNYIQDQSAAKISITKKNPDKWDKLDEQKDRWFISIEDFETAFLYDRAHANNTYFNKILPDLVISGLPNGLPLRLSDVVQIEKNPELPELLSDVTSAITKINAQYLKRQQPVLWRQSCKADCTCQSVNAYLKKNILNKFKFGDWKSLITKNDYEDDVGPKNWSICIFLKTAYKAVESRKPDETRQI